jgi:flagellar motor component MotA
VSAECLFVFFFRPPFVFLFFLTHTHTVRAHALLFPLHATSLQAMEKTLETLQAVQGQSVDELENQLVASKDILRRIQTSQRGQVLQNLISVLLSADTEGNMELDDDDIERLIQRLEQMHDVDINDAKVKALIIDNGRSVEAVMELARSAFLSESSKEDAVFQFLADTPAS